MAEYFDFTAEQMYEMLEALHDKYNNTDFIEADPISVPHSFTDDRDKEIAGFLAATIAWGNRKAIVRSARRMMEYMDFAPYSFVVGAEQSDFETLRSYVHRTFNGGDFVDFVRALQSICRKYGTVGNLFESSYAEHRDMAAVLSEVRREFFSAEHNAHCEKHFSSIDKGAACKRLNMYLRWFVRHVLHPARPSSRSLGRRNGEAECGLRLDQHLYLGAVLLHSPGRCVGSRALPAIPHRWSAGYAPLGHERVDDPHLRNGRGIHRRADV